MSNIFAAFWRLPSGKNVTAKGRKGEKGRLEAQSAWVGRKTRGTLGISLADGGYLRRF
jgi:hypothetical protein